MMGRNNGPILTDAKRNVLTGRYSGSRQAKYDHKKSVEGNLKPTLTDLQFLFKHLDQDNISRAFGEGCSSDEGPISWERPDHAHAGRAPDIVVNSEGQPVDPEHSPDADHAVEKMLAELEAPNKSSNETQEALIDSVAFLCRAAEAGELNISEVIERGVEKYHRESNHTDECLAVLKTFKEERYKQELKINHRRIVEHENADMPGEPDLLDIPISKRASYRYYKRENLVD